LQIPNLKSDPIPALVLAGGKTPPEFAAAAGVPATPGSRALADLHGLAMIRYVLRALQAASTIGPVLVVAPPGFPDQPEADLRVEADRDFSGNIAAGLEHCKDAEFVLIVTADLPFLTPEAVDEFVREGLSRGADCCYAGIPKEACDARFPGMKRTYLHTRGGSYTGGNVVLQRVSAFPRQAEMVREAYLRRKNPAFLARLIGPANLVKFFLRRLTQRDLEESVSRLLGVRCSLILTRHAELGTDIDKPDDIALARQLLKSR
jgi:molybdopterin-guanine dinucleotide biosynthesis protein A